MAYCVLYSVAHEKELKQLMAQITELQRQKEAALREVAELKVQLKMAEETRDTIRRDLIEANRKIREGKNIVVYEWDGVSCNCTLSSNSRPPVLAISRRVYSSREPPTC